MKAKVALCKASGIRMCPGGTLLEICDHQGRIEDYVRWLQRLGLTHVEVSNGAFGMETSRKRELIRRLSQDFTVLSECGSKNPTVDVVADEWVEEMSGDLEAGASILIAEARESGTVGLYTPNGEVRTELVEAIVGRASRAAKIIFEAPRKDQQAWFVRRLGAVANLGNIPADEVVALETLRLGLRSDTLDLLPDDGPHDVPPRGRPPPTPCRSGTSGRRTRTPDGTAAPVASAARQRVEAEHGSRPKRSKTRGSWKTTLRAMPSARTVSTWRVCSRSTPSPSWQWATRAGCPFALAGRHRQPAPRTRKTRSMKRP